MTLRCWVVELTCTFVIPAHLRRLTQTFPITNENTGGEGEAASGFTGGTPARLPLQAQI